MLKVLYRTYRGGKQETKSFEIGPLSVEKFSFVIGLLLLLLLLLLLFIIIIVISRTVYVNRDLLLFLRSGDN